MGNNISVNETLTEKEIVIEVDEKETKITRNKLTGQTSWTGPGDVPKIPSNALQLMFPDGREGGKISGICSLNSTEVVIFTNSPGCFWYWTGGYWIYRCYQ